MDGSSITPVHIRWQDLSLPDTENDRPWDESQISAWAEETFPDEDGVGEQHDQCVLRALLYYLPSYAFIALKHLTITL